MTLQSPHPREPWLPRRGGFQNVLFCQQIRMEGITRDSQSKVTPSGPPGRLARVSRPLLARGSDVERDLAAEILDAGELPLLLEASEKD